MAHWGIAMSLYHQLCDRATATVPDEWIKARPDFWKLPTMKTTSAAKPADAAAKPAGGQ